MPSFIDDLILKAALEPSLGVKNRKPIGPIEVDWTNPLSRGLELFWVINEMGGRTVFDVARGRNGTLSTDGTALPLWKVQPFLKSTTPCLSEFDTDSNKNYVQSDWPGILGTSARSFVVGYGQNGESVDAANTAILSYGDQDGASGERCTFGLNNNVANGTVGALRFEVNGGYYIGSTDLQTSNGIVGLSLPDGANVEDVQLFVNGKLESSSGSAAGQAVNTTSDADLQLGKNQRNRITGDDRFWEGRFFFVIMYSRELHPSEQRQLAENPYQILKPQGQFSVFMPAVAGGTTVTLSGVSATAAAGTLSTIGSAVTSLGGVSSTGSVGSLSSKGGAISILTGVSTTGQTGTLNIQGGATISLSGVSATGQAGTITVSTTGSASVVLSGVEATGQAGSIGAIGGATVNLDGIEASGSVGTLTIVTAGSVTVELSGVASSGQAGSLNVTGSAITDLLGVEATGEVGDLSASIAVAVTLTGVQATGQAGVFEVTTGAQVTLTGVSATGEVNSLTLAIPGGLSIDTQTHRIYAITEEDRTYLIVEENRVYPIH